MYKEQRHEEIIKYLYKNQEASVLELAKLLGTSGTTIRKDLTELDHFGKLRRTHGGATSIDSLYSKKTPHLTRDNEHKDAKIAIARAAVSMINDGDNVIIDSGSTANYMVDFLGGKTITVTTSDVRIAYRLSGLRKITTVICGGYLEEGMFTVEGHFAKELIESTSNDIYFFGMDAIDFEHGVSNKSLNEISLKHAMINSSKKVVAIFDSSKYGKKEYAKICDIDAIDTVITDMMKDEDRAKLEEAGIEVIIAKQ